MLYIAMILFGVFGIYTVMFVSPISVLKKVVSIAVAVGIILTGISGLLNLKRKDGRKRENSNS